MRCVNLEKKAIQNALCDANHPRLHSTHVGGVGRIEGPGRSSISSECLIVPLMAVKHLRPLIKLVVSRVRRVMVSITSMCTTLVLRQVNMMAYG